jgi:transcriptional regulator with XRE-family HTH domain
MYIADRLQNLREAKKLSQGDIEKRTGLLRCYISRVEKGHTVPSLETLEKFARAYEVPLYQIFYTGDNTPELQLTPRSHSPGDWASRGRGFRTFMKIRRAVSKLGARDRNLILTFAQQLGRRN